MKRKDDDIINYSIEFLKPYYGGVELSREEVSSILHNVSSYFELLAEWDDESSSNKKGE